MNNMYVRINSQAAGSEVFRNAWSGLAGKSSPAFATSTRRRITSLPFGPSAICQHLTPTSLPFRAGAVVYIGAVAQVLLHMDHHIYIVAYGLGFALGTFLGITIEQHLAFGQQLAALVTRRGVGLT